MHDVTLLINRLPSKSKKYYTDRLNNVSLNLGSHITLSSNKLTINNEELRIITSDNREVSFYIYSPSGIELIHVKQPLSDAISISMLKSGLYILSVENNYVKFFKR